MKPNGTLTHSVNSFLNHVEQRSDRVYGQTLRHKAKGTRCKEKPGVRRHKRGARFKVKGQRDCDSMTLRRKDAKTNKMQEPEYRPKTRQKGRQE